MLASDWTGRACKTVPMRHNKPGKPPLPGNRARQLREARGLPIQKVAADLGVDHSALSKVERKAGLDFEWLQRLSKYYHVNPTELIDLPTLVDRKVINAAENERPGETLKEEIVDYVVTLIQGMMREYTKEVVTAAFFRAVRPEERKERITRPI